MPKLKNTFRNLSDLENYFEECLNSVIRHEVFYVIRKEWLEVQQERVYNSYTPHKYQRREQEGGLADPDNIVLSEQKSKELTSFVLDNITKGNGWDKWNGKLINDMIEGTEGFSGNPLNGMPARPYTEETVANLTTGVSRNDIMRALDDGLKKFGFNINFK